MATVDAAVATVDATLVTGLSAVTAATTAAGAAVSATVGAESVSTRELLRSLLGNHYIPISTPRLTMITIAQNSAMGVLTQTLTFAGIPTRLDVIVYGCNYVTDTGAVLIRFEPLSPDGSLGPEIRRPMTIIRVIGSNTFTNYGWIEVANRVAL